MGFFDKLKRIVNKDKDVFENKDEKELYNKGFEKTRRELSDKLNNLSKKYKKINQDYFEELEEILIMADIGVNTVMGFMERLVDRAKKEKISDPEMLKELIVDELFIIYVNDEILVDKVKYNENGPTVILFVGVNGVGKTTTIAKMAKREKDSGKKVMLVAGDTFRAGAIEQLTMWGDKIGVKTISTKENADPSSVMYKALEEAKKDNYDVVLIDTAGRLQNKVNLMNELDKVNRVIGKLIEGAPHETLLVIDATTGQNGISQAKQFKEITNITGIALTKLDGTAKGGIVLAIKEEVNIPVKFIGLGEKMEDLRVFDIEKYIYGLFSELL
ncbi:MAG: signal recognition particle-docking protein FtsY [Bacilli bacterium]|nr:signal recognition particle-docking protein FtsY [Bacilli bacterium]